ncbi:hypothetical protein Kpho01_39730 [Kitasatospora phosalacinea]|uniref:DUF2252 domain-containing protein n=1 Tax=Kitasatospora phosalacinea TaxID=2065 RepID=A0A9W6UQA6_9ACTN|nr:hypothetical protein Kpho01_39730 [Kitasatospora phosalacinea]
MRVSAVEVRVEGPEGPEASGAAELLPLSREFAVEGFAGDASAAPGRPSAALLELAGLALADGPKRRGKLLRERVPLESHARLVLSASRPEVVAAVESANVGRLPHLVPLRVGRMAASPFAFLRGTAGLMAHDLATTPVSGIAAQLCGDAHAANFGLYGDARGRLALDLNDFDETVPGPWEWDLKRLAASLVLAGRQAGADEFACRQAAFDAAATYRRTVRQLAKLPVLDAWNAWDAIAEHQLVEFAGAHELSELLAAVSAKALRNTGAKFAARSTVRTGDGGWRFVAAPPVLSEVTDRQAELVAGSLASYRHTVPAELHPLLARFRVQDVAFRVVGTGSVGTRSYVVLLTDRKGGPLVLQVKEARESVLLPHLVRAGFPLPDGGGHEGRRVVLGQKRMQVVSDPLMGWTSVAGLPYQVRQFRNRKGSVDPAALTPAQLDDYGRLTGALLARAHAHTADAALIAGYCGKDDRLDDAVARFAVAYADQSEADHAALLAAVRSGRLAAEPGPGA